ncbi:preprotein translocase subunit YajC, partial [Staphylococcus epidermidis]|nr:preprotein translocase subunit YajC [Staphylococcus epidermidis]
MNVSALILPIILIIVFYFFLIRPQQKRAKEHREMISRIEAGQKITT